MNLKDNKVEPVSLDWDPIAQVESLTDKLNETVEALNTLQDQVHSLEINSKRGRR